MQNNKLSSLISMVLAMGLLLMYILGMFWPDTFWGTHFLAFVPKVLKYGLPLLITLLLVYTFYKREIDFNFNFVLNKKVIVTISIIMAIVFYNIDIIGDYYGDAKNFDPYLENKFTEFKDGFWSDLFSIQLKTGHARWGVFNLYSVVAYALKINMLQTFKLMDALFGAGFVFVWLLSVSKYSKTKITTIALIILGCTSPVVLSFCGHIETYGFVLFLIISWLFIFVRAFKEQNALLLWLLVPLSIICIRFNTPSIVLVPALIMTFIHHYSNKHQKLNSVFTLKKLFLYVLIPLIIIGILVYFFVFESHIDSRVLDANTNDLDRLFLPLFSPDAPLDTYNLLSWNHIFDFLMSFFFWSPGVLFLIGVILLNRKKIDWNNPLISILLLTFILFLGFLFMINPLMSLPMDWDLYTLPFPIALMLILLLLQQQSVSFIKNRTLFNSLTLHLLSIPVFIVLTNKTMHSYRIESVGVRVYKTYYQHAENYLLYSLQMLEGKERYATRKETLLQKLKPFVRGNIDQNYAALLLDEGINTFVDKNYIKSREFLLSAESYGPYLKLTQEYLVKVNNKLLKTNFTIPQKDINISDSLLTIGLKNSRENKQFEKAIKLFQRASFYNPTNSNIDLFQMESYFLKKDFKKALEKAEKLTLLKYPNHQQALRFAIHCALEAESYKKALYYSDNYLSLWPDDQFIQSIHQRLKNNNNISELKFKFAKIEK